MGNPANTVRNKQILHEVDVEGRTYKWLATKYGVSDTMIRRIYHREKYQETLAKQKAQEEKYESQ